MYLCWQYILLIYFSITGCLSTEIHSKKDAMKYLEHFGYIPGKNSVVSYALSTPEPGATKKMFATAISMFQMFTGLNQSGQFDEDTKFMMNMPRCGMAEKMESMENKNLNMSTKRHQIPKQRKWKASRIFYRIGNFPSSFEIDPPTVKNEIRRAFRLWEDVANIRCIEVEEPYLKTTEIDILFASGEHGDGNANAFGQDSYGNVVAHAFFPTHRHFDGDIHFDNQREWSAYNSSGINLFQVAAHEIGHALGLDHSRFPDSVMHMIVKSKHNESFQLHDDDIQGIQKLYGPRHQHNNNVRKHKIKHLSRLMPLEESTNSISTIPSTDMLFGEKMFAKTPKILAEVISPQPEVKAINLNAVITLPLNGEPDEALQSNQVSPLFNFWKCFALSKEELQTNYENTVNCYKHNVIRLLYSLKIV